MPMPDESILRASAPVVQHLPADCHGRLQTDTWPKLETFNSNPSFGLVSDFVRLRIRVQVVKVFEQGKGS
eukprot:scaffold35044_cov19-Prasinocladus_malaysianus.AAC.1